MQLKVAVPKLQEYKQIDNRWSQIKMGHTFSPRCSFAFCAQGAIGYLHGGYNSDQGTLGDMYTAKFNDPDDRNWYPLQQKGKQIPSKLKNHTLTSYLSYLICIGGQNNHSESNSSIFKYNLKNNQWSKLQIISKNEVQLKKYQNLLKRDSHCCFINKNKLYIFGGYLSSLGFYSNQTISLNLQKLESHNQIMISQIKYQQNAQIPQPRSSSACCILQNQAYIFGGMNDMKLLNDLWKFDLQTQKWQQINQIQNLYWPEERKGATLVVHSQSQSLILFGGMQQVTRQLNDLSIFLVYSKKWVKVHSNTNNIYDPSPTIKNQVENSPTILNHKGKRQIQGEFKLSISNVTYNKNASCEKNKKQQVFQNKYQRSKSMIKSQHKDVLPNYKLQKKRISVKTQTSFFKKGKTDPFSSTSFVQPHKQIKMSVVQQKKHRQFLARKKKLLSQICGGYETEKRLRPFSPTSQCLNYTLCKLGEQEKFSELKNPQFVLPKVIFDDKKSQVIGKKPCARDGHAAFGSGQNMYIIGGDRHTVSFNDTHLLKMDKAIQSLNYYT